MISIIKMLIILLITIIQFINGISAEKHLCEYPNWTIAQDVLYYYQRVELISEVDCVERCIENGDYCRAVLFMTIESASKKNRRKRNFCQFYNSNSDDLAREIKTRLHSSIDVDTNSDIENLTNSTILFEILDNCPRNAIRDDAEDSTFSKLNSSTKKRLRLITNENSSKRISAKSLSASSSRLNRLEIIDENNSANTKTKESSLNLLKDGVMSTRENALDLSGNSYVTGPKDSQKYQRNNTLHKETVMIGITNRVAPIRPVSVSHGRHYPGSPFGSPISQPSNCQNGICDSSSSAYQQSSDAAAIAASKPCAARHSSDPCGQKLTPQWTEWSPDGPCSVTCGTGTRKRIRFCNNATGCEGESTKTESCEILECNTWGKWSEWSRCTVSCGDNGQMMRERRCLNGNRCEGPSVDVRACGEKVCPSWAAWTAWSSACSVTCGAGWRTRQRECLPKGQNCPQGLPTERQPCELKACPSWTNWGQWSKCSKTCGGGEMVRKRECQNGLDVDCEGSSEERSECNLQECPTWSEWTLWSGCSRTCGDEGSRIRSRECRYNNLISNTCEGPAQDQTFCQLEPCPYWDTWTEWSGCSSTCGHGQQKRIRGCKPNNQGCKGGNQEIRFCQLAVCPYFDQWSEWSGCSVTCGRGFCEKRRKYCVLLRDPLPGSGLPTEEELVTLHSTNKSGLKPIHTSARPTPFDSVEVKSNHNEEELKSNRKGNRSKEAIKAEIIERSKNLSSQRPRLQGQLLEVAQSSSTFLPERKRTARNLIGYSPDNVPGCVGPEVERKECDAGPCCNWTQWTGWGVCNAKCGAGSKTRSRKCLVEPDFINGLTASGFIQNPESSLYAVSKNYRSIIPQNSGIARPRRQLQFPASYAIGPQPSHFGIDPFSNGFTSSNIQQSLPSISGICDCPGRSLEVEDCAIAVTDSDLCVHTAAALNNSVDKTKKQSSHVLNDAVLNHYSNFYEKTELQKFSENSNIHRPKACSWGTWTEYSKCSGTCARAVHSRSRECIRRDRNCECNGENYESEECQMPHCIQTFTLPSTSNGFKPLNSLLPSHEADHARLIHESEIISENYKINDERRSPVNNNSGQIRKLERLSILPRNSNSKESDDDLIFAESAKHRRERFQDPHWNSAHSKEILRQQDSVDPDDVEPQRSLLPNRDSTSGNERYCKWLEWREWSECISISSTNDCQSEWERTRSRICPCSSCEDGITQESESCVPESCR